MNATIKCVRYGLSLSLIMSRWKCLFFTRAQSIFFRLIPPRARSRACLNNVVVTKRKSEQQHLKSPRTHWSGWQMETELRATVVKARAISREKKSARAPSSSLGYCRSRSRQFILDGLNSHFFSSSSEKLYHATENATRKYFRVSFGNAHEPNGFLARL